MREVRSRRVSKTLLTAMVLCLLAAMLVGERQPLAQEAQRPNVLFVLTDDQATEDLAGMTNVQSLLVDRGTSFSQAFATTPQCCAAPRAPATCVASTLITTAS